MPELTTLSRELVETLSSFDPATLYEAAGQQGMVDPAIRRAWRGAKLCGPAFTIECPARDNLMLHRAVVRAQPGDILVATAHGELRAGSWGEILTVAAQARGIAGLAIDSAVRDIEAIEEHGFPIFSRGLAIGACTKKQTGHLQRPIWFGGIQVHPGDLIFGDSDGLVVIPKDRIEEVCAAALKRQAREREIMAALKQGKTTLDLLGLSDED